MVFSDRAGTKGINWNTGSSIEHEKELLYFEIGREMGESPSMEILKTHLDTFLCNLL